MKTVIGIFFLSSFLLSTTVGAQDVRNIGKDLLDQATRKSSCTYSLTIIGVTSNKTKTVVRESSTTAEACALAKTACHEIGNEEGFFGKHTCKKMNQDQGGLITRVVEGELPQSNTPERKAPQTNSESYSGVSNKISDITTLINPEFYVENNAYGFSTNTFMSGVCRVLGFTNYLEGSMIASHNSIRYGVFLGKNGEYKGPTNRPMKYVAEITCYNVNR